jgi:hypothetical protein
LAVRSFTVHRRTVHRRTVHRSAFGGRSQEAVFCGPNQLALFDLILFSLGCQLTTDY